MPRKYLRSVESSYELEDEKPADSIDIAEDLNNDRFADYDPDAYYTRATDYQGHCKNVQITIPTNYGPSIQRLIESDRNPYKNAAELARDALVHRIVSEIRKLGLEDDEEITDWFIETARSRDEEETAFRVSYLDSLERTCELLVQARDWIKLHQNLVRAAELDWPKGLSDRRDEIVRRYRDRFPRDFNPKYAAYMDV